MPPNLKIYIFFLILDLKDIKDKQLTVIITLELLGITLFSWSSSYGFFASEKYVPCMWLFSFSQISVQL